MIEQLTEKELRSRIADKCRQDGLRLTTKGYVPGSSVDADLVLGVLSGIGCLRRSSEVPDTITELPYLRRIHSECKGTKETSSHTPDVRGPAATMDGVVSHVPDTSNTTGQVSDDAQEGLTTSASPSDFTGQSKKRKAVVFGEILSLEPSLPLLDRPEERLREWRDLCYKESSLEEFEEGLLRRIAGQCKIKLRSKPYYTGTRYLQSIFEPRPSLNYIHESTEKTSSGLSLREDKETPQYTAEALFQKSKMNHELKGYFLRQNAKIHEVYNHFENSNTYNTFRRKYLAMMGGSTSTPSHPHSRSKVIPPLSLWADYHPIRNRHPDEIFADICIRSHTIPWSSVAQEFTTVEDPLSLLPSNPVDEDISIGSKADAKPQSPVPFKRSSSFSDVVKRKLSNPVNMVVLAPAFREIADTVFAVSTFC